MIVGIAAAQNDESGSMLDHRRTRLVYKVYDLLTVDGGHGSRVDMFLLSFLAADESDRVDVPLGPQHGA